MERLHGLSLELKSGDNVWTLVCVMKPNGEEKCLSVVELLNMDDIEILSHAVDDVPGVVLTKGSSRVWMPVASRTRSRLKSSDIVANLLLYLLVCSTVNYISYTLQLVCHYQTLLFIYYYYYYPARMRKG